MAWDYAIIAALFILGVLLAFPLAIGVLIVVSSVFVVLDRFTDNCPGFRQIRRWRRVRRYRPGQVISRFLAPDVRRDVEVVNAENLDAGFLIVRSRTWNVLYVINGLSSAPAFGEVRRVALRDL